MRVVDGMHERICMAMHEFPVRASDPPKYPCNAERPVLLGKISNDALLSFNDHKHSEAT